MKLQLIVDATTITIPFTRENATEIQGEFSKLLQTFALKSKAERPKRWEAMDYKLRSSATHSQECVQGLELFCNPNAYTDHIHAKVLVTFQHHGLKITTEAKLHSLKSNIDVFLQP
jgi:hypothetical protein